MPAPGQTRAAVFRLALRDPIWEAIYAPIVWIVTTISTRLNHLQFLTIRQYLSVVFGALVFLLLLLAGWP
jgi:hydrogenase-4 component B